ncbi:hypothetical protein ES703_124327 [subsurface metagenome]
MAEKKKVGLQALLDVKRFVPSPIDLLKPFPEPKQGEMVMQGISADVLSWAFGYIPTVGDFIGSFVNDNIMADVLVKLSPEQKAEFREQNRVYPNGIALLRTFQRIKVAPGSRL